jgi:SAM-dependent methyltransferase
VQHSDSASADRYRGHVDAATFISRTIGAGEHVLLVGTTIDSVAKALEEKGCTTTAIAFDQVAADQASVYCDAVSIVRPEGLEFDPSWRSRFQSIVFVEALEHVSEARKVLLEALASLQEGGKVLAVIPNTTFGAVRLAVMGGDYAAIGRFAFPKERIEEIFAQAGLYVSALDSISAPIFAPGAADRARYSDALLAEIERGSDALVSHYVVAAVPYDQEALQSVTREFRRTRADLSLARETIERQSADAQSIREVLEEYAGRITELEWRTNELPQAPAPEAEFEKFPLSLAHSLAKEASAQNVAILGAELDSLRENSATLEQKLAEYEAKKSDMFFRIGELEDLERFYLARIAEIEQSSELERAESAQLQARATELEESERVARHLQRDTQANADTLRGQLRSAETEVLTMRAASEAARIREAEKDALREELAARLAAFEEASEAQREANAQRVAELTASEHVARHLHEVAQSELDAARRAEAERIVAFEEMAQRARGLEDSLRARADQYADLEERLAGLETSNQTARLLHDAAEAALEAARKREAEGKAAHEAIASRAGDLEAALDAQREENTELANRLANLAASERAARQLHEAAQVELDEARVRASTLERDAVDARAQLEAALHIQRDENAELASRLANLEASERAARQQHEAAKVELDHARVRASTLERDAVDARAQLEATLRIQRDENAELASRLANLEASERAARSLYETAQVDLDHARLRAVALEHDAVDTRAQLEAARASEAQFRFDNETMRSRITSLQESLQDAGHANEQIGEALVDLRSRYLEIEERALLAVSENQAAEQRAEEAWFEIYAELETVRERAGILAEELARRGTTIEGLNANIAEMDLALQDERRCNARTLADHSVAREALEATQAALVEARRRSDAHAADLAVVKVRALQTELRIPEYERVIEDGARYASHLQSEIEMTRKAALAERIVMRDYADETQAKNDARARDYEAIVANLTRESNEGRQQLENLWNELDRVREEHARQVAELQAAIAAANAHGEEMRELLVGAERRLLDQAEDVIADMHAESAQLVLLIDTVQSSHFWKLKRWLGRLLGRNRR